MSETRFGHTELPDDVEKALKKGRRLEIITLCWMVIAVSMIYIVMGSSQAMKAAWIEDCLSFLPPIAFLLATRNAAKKPDDRHRYGFHRSVGAGHLAAAIALLAMGAFLIFDSGMTLLSREHPTIGTTQMFGHTFWLGWLMIVVLIINNVPSVILGRLKLPVSEKLHDKILYADADMNKADWQTASGAILGIIGIGFGLWWADSVVAILIAISIVRDGLSNVKAAVRGLLDHQAMTYDDSELLPLIREVEEYFRGVDWAQESWVRMRDQGHVMHTEVFVRANREVTRSEVQIATREVRALDWKLQDTLVLPVDEFPHIEAER